MVLSRRSFLHAALAHGVLSALSWPFLRRPGPGHPTPRPGVTGARVLTTAGLGGAGAHLAPLFDGIRAIPAIADGIRCHCGCAELPGMYSLLSCYEGQEAMARVCPICQGEGRVAVRLHKEGKSLAEIREAIDAQFG